MREIKIGKVYKHFKGNLYKVIDIVYDCESNNNDLKTIVIYQQIYGENLKWARKYEDFASNVDRNKYPKVFQKYRFEEINEAIEKK